jgi:putative ABC transport system permease protein
MIIANSLKMSWQNLRANKTRSFLTMLGIIIGISSVIIVLSVGAGAQSLIVNQIQSTGSNLIGILPGGGGEDGPPAAVFGITITTLTDDDRVAIEKIPTVAAVASYVTSVQSISWGNQKTDATVTGTTVGYPLVTDSELDEGYFFNIEDEKSLNNVVVLGSQVKIDLFGNSDAIDEFVKIKKERFRVIGVMKAKGVSGFQNVDDMVFIPVTVAQKKLVGINHVGFIRAKASNEAVIDDTVEQIKMLLRDRHNIDDPTKDDFTVNSTKNALDMLLTITDALKLFLTAIAAISLFVGGIGIMNIMLAAVTERIKEIGLKKALGAKRVHIIWQFLIETMTITLFGSIIGVSFGALISFLISLAVKSQGYSWEFTVSIFSIILACGSSLAIGFLFGLYPANKAAKLDPIEALHYE